MTITTSILLNGIKKRSLLKLNKNHMNEDFVFTPEMEQLMLQDEYLTSLIDGGTVGINPAVLIFGLFVFLVIYLFTAFAFMNIAKKMSMDKPWLAFIPVANLYLVSKMAKMHWWPILLMVPAFIPVLGSIFSIALSVFVTIWLWKIFVYFKKPGWWVLLQYIPVVNIAYFYMLGKIAWGKEEIDKPKEEITEEVVE